MNKEHTKWLMDNYKFLRPSQPTSIVKENMKKMSKGNFEDVEFIEDLMVFGFECDDGWFELIDNLCSTIQNYVSQNEGVEDFKASQIKEKYGSLRFYADGADDYIQGMIRFAEEMSFHICEVCGEHGCLSVNSNKVTSPWFKTLCTGCRKKLKYQKAKVM